MKIKIKINRKTLILGNRNQKRIIVYFLQEDMMAASLANLTEADLAAMGMSEKGLAFMRAQIAKAKPSKKTPEELLEAMSNQYQQVDKETKGLYKAIAAVMEQCLSLSNPACVESGLHGLGHLVSSFPDIAVPIIDRYLKNGKTRSEGLVNYAKSARTGMIQ